jgi:hypothetical protein
VNDHERTEEETGVRSALRRKRQNGGERTQTVNTAMVAIRANGKRHYEGGFLMPMEESVHVVGRAKRDFSPLTTSKTMAHSIEQKLAAGRFTLGLQQTTSLKRISSSYVTTVIWQRVFAASVRTGQANEGSTEP